MTALFVEGRLIRLGIGSGSADSGVESRGPGKSVANHSARAKAGLGDRQPAVSRLAARQSGQ